MILHGRASSSNVQAVMWGAAEMGIALDRRDLGGRFGGLDTPEFLAMNPMGKIPVLEDGNLIMFESAAILRHLLAQTDGGALTPSPQGDMWAEWAKHTLCRAFILDVFWAYYRTPAPQRNMDAVMTALRAVEKLLAMGMTQRAGRLWLLGDQPSLADIWFGHVLYRYFTLDLPRAAPDGLRDYYDMLCDRPHYARHVMVDFTELAARTTF